MPHIQHKDTTTGLMPAESDEYIVIQKNPTLCGKSMKLGTHVRQ